MRFLKKYRLAIIVVFLLCARLFHMGETIDTPHAWRQYDTKQYIDAYYHENVSFLEPAVCWMGGHKTLALEFPLPEFLAAQLYKIFGPQLWVSRTFFLLFFLISVVFLYKSLKLVFSDIIPEISVLIYGLMPLSLYFSRAIHIDFFVFAFVFAMLYYSMLAIRNEKFWQLFIALICATIAFLVKAPYVFYFSLPILMFAIHEGKFNWFIKRSILFAVPVLLLWKWTSYTKALNLEVPDWSFVPNFNNFTEMWYWYFGTWDQRTNLTNWSTIGGRILWEVLGYTGSILMVIGLVFTPKNRQFYWTLTLFFGTAIYGLIFFNLNLIHNYYQLPFTVCCALIMALGIQWIVNYISKNSKTRMIIIVVILGSVAFEGIQYAESNYYNRNEGMEHIAEQIRIHTKQEDLIIVSFGGLSPQCPLLLQPAGRYGWSVPIHDITPKLIFDLWKTGDANKLAVVYNGYFEGEFKVFFEAMKNKIGIPLNNNGQVLYICDLNF